MPCVHMFIYCPHLPCVVCLSYLIYSYSAGVAAVANGSPSMRFRC